MRMETPGYAGAQVSRPDLNVTGGDRAILGRLAARVAELAALDIQNEKRDLWFRHNALEETRPLIFCDPENGWHEILDDQMQCEGGLARGWEWYLRREIFWGESMGDDRVIEPVFDVGYSYTQTDWGMHETRSGGGDGGAFAWESPLQDYDDMDKLRYPEITVDYEHSAAVLSLAKEVIEPHLQVNQRGAWWWSLGTSLVLASLRGLQQMMFDMFDHPTELHRLSAFLRDAYLHRLDFLENNGLLSLNSGGQYVGSGGFGYTRELPQSDFNGDRVRTRDMWGFCESQETVSLSADMFDEFVFQYQLPILERFGLNCYGCCEPLDKRWDVVKKTPNLRRVSVSAWCNLVDMAEKVGDQYLYSMKPLPSPLASPQMDEDLVRKSLRDAIAATRGCRVEIIMKDCHTIGRNPENVTRWCKIAREEAERVP